MEGSPCGKKKKKKKKKRKCLEKVKINKLTLRGGSGKPELHLGYYLLKA